MESICCTPDPPDYKSLLPEDRQRFGFLVHQLRKKGYHLKEAQERAYMQVVNESIPYEREC